MVSYIPQIADDGRRERRVVSRDAREVQRYVGEVSIDLRFITYHVSPHLHPHPHPHPHPQNIIDPNAFNYVNLVDEPTSDDLNVTNINSNLSTVAGGSSSSIREIGN